MIYGAGEKKNFLEQLEDKLGQGRVKTEELLSFHTTFKIGGPADFYYEAGTVEELIKAVKLAENLKIPYFVLGGGSNILVGDRGFRGLVIKNKSRQIKILGYGGKIKNKKWTRSEIATPAESVMKIKNILVEVDAGVSFNQLVRFTIEEGLAGLEGFLGLPGTVGGAVAVNAHWQGKEVGELVVSQKTFDKVLLSVVFSFRQADKNLLWEKASQAVEYRRTTQPLGMSSAGCIFKNIKASEAARIGTANFTTSAGFLIEAAGLAGTKIGNVQISPIHANFIVNLGGGKATDVLKLISLTKKKVKEKFGVDLTEEIIRVGEF